MSEQPQQQVVLLSEDGVQVPVSLAAFKLIGIFKSTYADSSDCDADTTSTAPMVFPVHAVTSPILHKVVQYLALHEDDPAQHQQDDACDYTRYTDLISPNDRHFIATMDVPTLLELAKAANYLFIPDLLDLACRAVAGHMRGLSTEELRKKFNIANDFTPEEEERVRKETIWASDL